MSILNLASDGLPSVLITLARLVAQSKSMARDDLISISMPPPCLVGDDKDITKHIRNTLSRWTQLGLFLEDCDRIRLSNDLRRGESLDQFTNRLPMICRNLLLCLDQCEPMWSSDGTEKTTGTTADVCRALAWLLSQDIYSLPTSSDHLERIASEQVKPGYFIFINKERLPGFRAWAKFLGFAVGDGPSCDITEAVQSELFEIIKVGEMVSASEFLARLASRLPVIDSGSYRKEVEKILRPEKWSSPPVGQLSTALSFALRRLQKQGVISLSTLADAGSRMTLTRQGGQVWESFTHVSLLRALS